MCVFWQCLCVQPPVMGSLMGLLPVQGDRIRLSPILPILPSISTLLGSGRAVEAISLDSIGLKESVWCPFLKRALKIL